MLSGISLPHILLLLLIVVLVFGTSKLKNLGKDLGGAVKGFKEAMRGDEGQAPSQPVAPPAQLQQDAPQTSAPQQAQPAATPTSQEPRQGQ